MGLPSLFLSLSLFLGSSLLNFNMDRLTEALQLSGIFSPILLLLSVDYHIDSMS